MTFLKSVWKRDIEEQNKNEIDSGFTLITEQNAPEAKASESPNAHLDMDTRTLTAHMHKPSTKTDTHAMQSAKEEEIALNKKGATTTAMTSLNGDRDNGTSSDQERAGGILIHFGCHPAHVLYIIVIIFTKTPCC